MAPRTTPPFRADHVGSLLRPPELHRARTNHAEGRVGADELRAVEDEAIRAAVRLQAEAGLRSATDGEFRRSSWHMDFIYSLGGVEKVMDSTLTVEFRNADGTMEFTPPSLRVAAPVHLDETIFADAFTFLAGQVGKGITPKLTIPSPSMVHYRGGRASIGGDPEHQHEAYIRHLNEALAGRPGGMAVTTHMCRGNFRSAWAAEGGYEFVAEALFTQLDVDGFFLEYDDERSGGFEPLRFVPPGKMVVLGLVTTKRGELERKDDLKRRIEEASRFVDVEQLCLSPQCGFASTVEGNALTVDQELAKLRLVVETAADVWG